MMDKKNHNETNESKYLIKELNRSKFENDKLRKQKTILEKNTKKAKDLFEDALAVKMQYE